MRWSKSARPPLSGSADQPLPVGGDPSSSRLWASTFSPSARRGRPRACWPPRKGLPPNRVSVAGPRQTACWENAIMFFIVIKCPPRGTCRPDAASALMGALSARTALRRRPAQPPPRASPGPEGVTLRSGAPPHPTLAPLPPAPGCAAALCPPVRPRGPVGGTEQRLCSRVWFLSPASVLTVWPCSSRCHNCLFSQAESQSIVWMDRILFTLYSFFFRLVHLHWRKEVS